jgi:hypothetical protein
LYRHLPDWLSINLPAQASPTAFLKKNNSFVTGQILGKQEPKEEHITSFAVFKLNLHKRWKRNTMKGEVKCREAQLHHKRSYSKAADVFIFFWLKGERRRHYVIVTRLVNLQEEFLTLWKRK